MKTQEYCDECDGLGHNPENDEDCDECDGQGTVWVGNDD